MDDFPHGGLQQPNGLQQPGDDAAVDAFLRANPDFLAARPALYEVLQPPCRIYGAPVADHMAAMVERTRARAARAERAAAAAAADRRANEGFARRVQDAVVALLRAPDPAWAAAQDLAALLCLDAARLCSEAALPPRGAARIAPGTVAAALGQRPALLRAGIADAALHGEAVALATTEALVRVPLASGPALLALACRDGDALAGATTEALAFLGEAAAAALGRPPP